MNLFDYFSSHPSKALLSILGSVGFGFITKAIPILQFCSLSLGCIVALITIVGWIEKKINKN